MNVCSSTTGLETWFTEVSMSSVALHRTVDLEHYRPQPNCSLKELLLGLLYLYMQLQSVDSSYSMNSSIGVEDAWWNL